MFFRKEKTWTPFSAFFDVSKNDIMQETLF